MKKLLMFAAVAAALGLGSTSLSAQAYTAVTATNVTVDNGSGSPVNPPSGSQLCFLGVNAAGAAITYTPSGGGPVTGTVCGTLNSSGALTGSLQVANPALASPIGLLYTITVINGSTTYLTLPTVSLSGAVFAYDNYAVAGNGTVTGIGYPHIACNVGSQWTSTTIMPGGATCGPVGGSAAWLTYPAVPYCPVGQAYLAPQGNQTVALCLSPSLSGLGSPTGLCANKSTYFQQDAASGSFLWGCVGTAWQQEAGSGGGTGLTSFQGRTTPAATLQAADVTGVLQNSPFNFTGTNELAFDSASGTPAPTTNWLLDGSGNLGGKKNLYLGASPFSLPTITLNALTGAILGANGNFGVDASGNIMAGSLSAGGCLTAVANVITATGGGCGSSPTLYYQTAQLNLANLTQRSRLNFTSASGITAADNSGNNSTDVSLLQASTSQFGAAKCDGTSISCTGGVFTATGGGGSATLNPNPPTTAYVFYNDSRFIVSADATFCQSDGWNISLQALLPTISGATISGGTTGVFSYTAAAAAPVVGNILYLNGFTGTLSALNGQTITVSALGSGTFTATVSGVANGTYTDSGIAPCAYNTPRQFQQSPLVAGHGVIANASIGGAKAADMDTDFATVVAAAPAVTAAISAASPIYLILMPPMNDFGGLLSCPTLSTLEGHMTSIMSKFHALAANAQVILVGNPPNGAVAGLGCHAGVSIYQQFQQDLRSLYAQNAANNTAGTYYDGYIDETGMYGDSSSSMQDSASAHFTRAGNAAMASDIANYFGTHQQKLDKVASPSVNEATLNGTNTYTGTTNDYGLTTHLYEPNRASFASAANGELGYDTTNLNWHIWSNAADNFLAVFPVASPPTSGDCVQFTKSTNSWKLADAGAPCNTGTTTNALTAATSGGAAPGTTFNGSAAVTLDYQSLGAAPLASPTFTGTPAAPTATGGTNTTQLATTAFVQAAIAAAGTGAGIVTYSGPSVALTGTQYFPIGGGATSSTTETNVDIDSPAAVTIQNMTVQMSVAPGIGNSIVFTWRKNGSSTALTCTISGASATSCSDTTHSFTTASLDLLSIQAMTTGTVAGTPTIVMAAQVGVGTAGAVTSVFGQTGVVPDLSGDATTSGSSAVTVAKVNGVSISGTPASGYVPTATSGTAATWQAPTGSGAWTNITDAVTVSGCTASSGACTISGSTTTAVTFSSIPVHNRMQIVVWGQGSAGTNQATSAYVVLTFNGDSTTGHYTLNGIVQQGTSSPSANQNNSTTGCFIGQLGSTGVSHAIFDIPFYANTTFSKSGSMVNSGALTPGTANNWSENMTCGYNQTTAITSVTATINSGHYVAGTIFEVLVQD